MQKLYRLILIIMTIFIVVKCQPTLRDERTFSTIDELQGMTINLYETFALKGYNENRVEQDEGIQNLKVRLNNARDYEVAKQSKTKTDNSYTIKQFKRVERMIIRHIKDYQSANIWSEAHKNNVIKNVIEAFNIMRDTEGDKRVQDDFLGRLGV